MGKDVVYETDTMLNQYLLFHYGNDHDQLPFAFGPHDSINFPVRCVRECLDVGALPAQATALELGCAVGRSSFELALFCDKVVAVDNSQAFIHAAKQIQDEGQLEYRIQEQGAQQSPRIAKRPENCDFQRIEFRCCDVMELSREPAPYDVVMGANLLCRLSNPQDFLAMLPQLVAPKGQLILTTPYSWLEEFTPRSQWLGKNGLDCLKNDFTLNRTFDLPFLMREHLRKYQWVVTQATLWTRKSG